MTPCCCCCCEVTSVVSDLCDPIDGSPPGSAVMGFSRQEYWSGLPLPSPDSLRWADFCQSASPAAGEGQRGQSFFSMDTFVHFLQFLLLKLWDPGNRGGKPLMGEQMFLGIKLPQRRPLHGLSRAGFHQPAAAEVSGAAGSEVTVLSPPLNLACMGLWLTIAPPPPSFLSLLKDGLLTQELENQRQTLWAPGKRLWSTRRQLCVPRRRLV